MTTTNLSATVTRASLPTCWVKDGENYIFMKKGGQAVRQRLPYVGVRYEQVLKELGIPYEIVQLPDLKYPGELFTACAFWDPKSYWVHTQTLPVYQRASKTKDIFVRTGEMHEGKIFGTTMISKAMETKKVVMQAVEAQKASIQAAKCQRAQQKSVPAPTKVDEDFLKKALGSKSATVVKIANTDIDNEVNIGDIKIVPAYYPDGKKNGFYGIFDMAKLQYVTVIKLVVPEDEARKIYGARKMNQQYWQQCCGKGIKIISAKE